MRDDELEAWIASAVGQPVKRLERVGYGASRATFIAEMQTGDDLVARVDTGDGPMAGTELSLAREAEVYRALAGRGVRIPALHAVSPAGDVLLADRAPGTHVLDQLDAPARDALFDDFIDAIGELHNVEVNGLDLPSYRWPADGPAHAGEEIDLWNTILEHGTTGLWPLAHFTREVLRSCAPTTVSRTVLCHGDVGPGNFVHDGGRVTALLDWEFSHVGDPMDDLGWWVFRGHDMRGNCGDLAGQLKRWQDATGLPVDTRSVDYYRAMVIWRWLVSVASALDRGGPGMDRSVYFGLVPVLEVRLPRALAALLDVDLPDPPSLPEPAPGPNADVLEALRSDLATVVMPAASTPEVARRVGATLLYVSHLDAVDRAGPALREAELDDVFALTGTRPASTDDARRAVMDEVAEGGRTSELLGYFWRAGHRHVAVWPVVTAVALGEPTVVPTV